MPCIYIYVPFCVPFLSSSYIIIWNNLVIILIIFCIFRDQFEFKLKFQQTPDWILVMLCRVFQNALSFFDQSHRIYIFAPGYAYEHVRFSSNSENV